MAQISKEPGFLKALKEDLDLHCFSASLIYGIPYEDFIDKETGKPFKDGEMAELRSKTKSISFGIIYGIGANKLAANLKIDVKEAKDLLTRYFLTFPRIKELIDKLAKDAEIHRYAISPLDGRRRDLADFDWDNPKHAGHAMNIAKNLPFQGKIG